MYVSTHTPHYGKKNICISKFYTDSLNLLCNLFVCVITHNFIRTCIYLFWYTIYLFYTTYIHVYMSMRYVPFFLRIRV